MEKMIVTQALDERDLLLKRINDSIARAKFVSVKKPNDEMIREHKQNVEDFERNTKAVMQSIRDLIDRYNRLDAAILLANATTTIEVAGVTLTRAAAINLRKSIMGTGVHNSNFEQMLIEKMTGDFEEAKLYIAKSQEVADKQREAMTNSLASSEKKNLSEDSLKNISAYCDNLVFTLVDPVDIEKTIVDMQKKQDELKAGLESAIKISNATTYVEF